MGAVECGGMVTVDERYIRERERLLEAIPECPEHGPHCLPHAHEWIDKMKQAEERMGAPQSFRSDATYWQEQAQELREQLFETIALFSDIVCGLRTELEILHSMTDKVQAELKRMDP